MLSLELRSSVSEYRTSDPARSGIASLSHEVAFTMSWIAISRTDQRMSDRKCMSSVRTQEAPCALLEVNMETVRKVQGWQQLHDQLRGIARRRAALDAEEARCLREAHETKLWRRVGYAHMNE